MHDRRQMPAEPLKIVGQPDRLRANCSTTKCPSTARARARAESHRRRGIDVTLIHRSSRDGYKAGALANGLKSARGEYVAMFDADFVPAPDFLRRLMPYFAASASIGFVQARWEHLNLKPVTRPVEGGCRVNDALGHGRLVIQGQLHCDDRQVVFVLRHGWKQRARRAAVTKVLGDERQHVDAV